MLPINAIIAIVVSALVAGAGLFIALYFLFLRNKKLTHQIHDLKRRYDYTNHMLTIQDLSYIKRIEAIAQLNLLYADMQEDYRVRYKKILNDHDALVKQKLNTMLDYLKANRYKSAREEMANLKALVVDYETVANALNTELLRVIQPEEDAKRQEAEAKEKFHKVQEDYAREQENLLILKNSYEKVFAKVLRLFLDFDDYIDEANYDEANALLPLINKVIDELQHITIIMPELCHRATKSVPQRIGDLKNDYKRILNEECSVVHIMADNTISKMEDELAEVVENLKAFKYRHQDEALNYIVDHVENILTAFNKEREAKGAFDSKIEVVRQDITFVEKDFIKLCNSLPKIRQVYIITDDKLHEVTNIQNLINKLGVAKRAFDNLLHNGNRTPYSVLLDRLIELQTECDQIKADLANFRQYITSLKEDVQDAHRLLAEYFYQIKKAEKRVRDAAMDLFHTKYDEPINAIYNALETISVTSTTLPIDVNKVNEAVNFVRFEGDSTLNQIEQDSEMMKMAESALTYVNRGRYKFNEIDALVNESEKLFKAGEFEKAYLETKDRIIPRYAELTQEQK
ncbi:MAG: septation ring formation regulator EzrA [Bacilli bacterium]|nr:septation ring formation regulator EzrA [Bacilli bacterium]